MANSEWLFCWKSWLPSLNTRLTLFTLLRRKPRVFRPRMNVGRVPFEAPKERSTGYASEGSACLREAVSTKAGPTKHVEELRALARGAPLPTRCFFMRTRKGSPGKSGQTFLWMTPGFRIRGSSQLKHFSKYCLKVILLRSWQFSQFPYHISLFHRCLFAESNIRLPEKTAFPPLADFIIRLSSIS